MHLKVDAALADERRVQLLTQVGREDVDLARGGSNAVEGVEEAAEAEGGLGVLARAILAEERVDVLYHHNDVLWQLLHQNNAGEQRWNANARRALVTSMALRRITSIYFKNCLLDPFTFHHMTKGANILLSL